jgi:hypothetical protein
LTTVDLSDEDRDKAFYHFFFPADNWQLTSTEELSPTLPGEFRALSAAFSRNLDSVTSTVSMPFLMASGAVRARRFQQLHMAERIRARSDIDAGETPESAARLALERAIARMKEEEEAPESEERYASEILRNLSALPTAKSLERPRWSCFDRVRFSFGALLKCSRKTSLSRL